MNLDENSAQGMYFRTGASCRRWDTEEICLIDSRFLSPFSLSFFFFFAVWLLPILPLPVSGAVNGM